jgi:micrococcal nuclease
MLYASRESSIQYRVSSIQYRVSSIQYRVSSIQYRVSSIQYQVPSIVIAFLLLLFVQPVVCDQETGQEAKVIDVVDGVTIIVSYAGNPVSCIYIGVSAPGSEDLLSFSKARQFNKDLVAGKTVQLEFDEQKYDRYGRLLAYVHCGDVFVNAELIRQGYGSVAIVSPNTRYAEQFLRLESEAREAKRGLWAEPGKMGTPIQSVASLGKQIALMAKKIDELSSKIDQLLEIIRESQSQPKNVPSPAHHPEQGKTDEQVNAGTVEEQTDQIVYITRSGKKYHKLGCQHLRGGRYESITVDEAKRRGLEPCSVCFPEEARRAGGAR